MLSGIIVSRDSAVTCAGLCRIALTVSSDMEPDSLTVVTWGNRVTWRLEGECLVEKIRWILVMFRNDGSNVLNIMSICNLCAAVTSCRFVRLKRGFRPPISVKLVKELTGS